MTAEERGPLLVIVDSMAPWMATEHCRLPALVLGIMVGIVTDREFSYPGGGPKG